MLSFTIEPVKLSPRSPITTIRGTKEQDINDILVNGSSNVVRFPSNTSWEYDYVLNPGENSLTFRGKDSFGNYTQEITITIKVPEPESDTYSVFNILDDWGLQLDTPRIKGEKNQYYFYRLLHAEKYKGGPIYNSLIEAIRRELSLDSIEEAFTISLPSLTSSTPYRVTKEAYVSITPTAFLIESDSLVVKDETVIIDNGTREGTLNYRPLSKEEIILVTSSGDRIPKEDIELIDTKKIRVHNSPTILKASYKYVLEFKHEDNTDLNTLAININSSTNTSSNQVVVATVDSSATSYKPKYLKRVFREKVTDTDPLKITAYNFRIVELFDEEFQESLLDSNQLYFGTKLERYANELNNKAPIFIKDTLLDKDFFIDGSLPRSFSVLPYRFDSFLSYYKNADDVTDTKMYSYWEYKWYSGSSTYPTLERKGINPEDIEIGPGLDLKVRTIEESNS